MSIIETNFSDHYGFDFANGEQLAANAYDNLIKIVSLMPDAKRKTMNGQIVTSDRFIQARKMNPFRIWKNGLYILAAKRPQWIGYFDVNVDDLPLSASVLIKAERPQHNFGWLNLTKIEKLPRGVWAGGKSRSAVAVYEVDLNILLDFQSENRELNSNVTHLLILRDGSIFATQEPMKVMHWESNDAHNCHHHAAAALSMMADSRYLWNVECSDGETKYSKVIFGIEMEEVKSLMFARDTPMTETGRKRPILHWVNAHNRRISSGIDIDIKKHLRGITEFCMGGLDFKITSPIK